MYDPITIVNCICYSITEFLIKVIIRIQRPHGQKDTTKAFLKKMLIFFIRYTPPNLPANIIQRPFPCIEASSNLLFEYLKFP